MARVKVFISGPYTMVDPIFNTRRAVKMWRDLWKSGFAPYCPHLNMLIHFLEPIEYEECIEHCFEYLRISDCLIRITGDSEGADREVEYAVRHNIPVFYSIDTLRDYYQIFAPAWTDQLFDVLHECQDQAIRGGHKNAEEALDAIKKVIYYDDHDEKRQLLKIAALAISALSRM